MTNTLNTPVETIESTFPLRITEYNIRRNTGGSGAHRGGDGLRRAYELLTDAQVTLMTERRRLQPWGLQGAESGAAGANYLRHKGAETLLPGKQSFMAEAGDVVVVDTPGGGGWGEA